MVHKIVKFFDRLEDRVRSELSHYPIIYAFISGIGIVLFWRGVWDTADLFPFMTGPISLLLSLIILLVTGLFVSLFVGDNIIIAGIKRDKKIIEKTEIEIEMEEKKELDDVKKRVQKIDKNIEEIKELLLKK
ncbi:MAG: hypothetical protein AAB488_01545 [Patescibacteria group bacterium]